MENKDTFKQTETKPIVVRERGKLLTGMLVFLLISEIIAILNAYYLFILPISNGNGVSAFIKVFLFLIVSYLPIPYFIGNLYLLLHEFIPSFTIETSVQSILYYFVLELVLQIIILIGIWKLRKKAVYIFFVLLFINVIIDSLAIFKIQMSGIGASFSNNPLFNFIIPEITKIVLIIIMFIIIKRKWYLFK